MSRKKKESPAKSPAKPPAKSPAKPPAKSPAKPPAKSPAKPPQRHPMTRRSGVQQDVDQDLQQEAQPSQRNRRSRRNRTTSSASTTSTTSTTCMRSSKVWGTCTGFAVLAILVGVSVQVIGSTRQNGLFESNAKLVEKTGLDDPERYWGSYRPGAYFAMSTREPFSPVMGLMWFADNYYYKGKKGLRHLCDINDNLHSIGWLEHDGRNFGVQEIKDNPFIVTTSFVKKVEGQGNTGGHWTIRLNVTTLDDGPRHFTVFFYAAIEEGTPGYIAVSPTHDGIEGYTKFLGRFSVTPVHIRCQIRQASFLSTRASGLGTLTETVLKSLEYVKEDGVAGYYTLPNVVTGNANFTVLKMSCRTPLMIDFVYDSKNASVANDLHYKDYSYKFRRLGFDFHMNFFARYSINDSMYTEQQQDFAKAAASNVIGGIGYFYGSSSVQSANNTGPVPYWEAPLYTSVPSRTSFPHGSIWDEGFHSLVIFPWDKEIAFDIIFHWFDLMNTQGWIPRQKMPGSEALRKDSEEYLVQRNTLGHPPTFFIVLDDMLRSSRNLSDEDLGKLQRLYPRLVAWFDWLNHTQRGEVPSAYRWRGRNPDAVKLNPTTVASGLYDYPRASHPTDDERHLDLRCWLALGARVLVEMADRLDVNGKRFADAYMLLSDNALLKSLHWSEQFGRFADYGLHSNDVILQRAQPEGDSSGRGELVRVTREQPRLRLVHSHFGYVSLFPLLFNLLDPDSPMLEKVLLDLKDPDLLWTKFGLRSLSPSSPLYQNNNSEDDPPAWRGPIWINFNVLAVRALRFYSTRGPYQELTCQILDELRINVLKNVMRQYRRTGSIWEQYSDVTGEGMGTRPFTGSSLVVLLM